MSGGHKIPRVHKQTLVEMNVPVFTARRDAAHDRALELLRKELPLSDRASRQTLYGECDRLLGDAILFNQKSQQTQHETPIARYLHSLQETVHLSLAHQRHSDYLVREAQELSRLTGAPPPAGGTGDAFSNSELQMLAFVEDLLQFGEPLLRHDSVERQKHFSDDDRRRFALARAEYDRHYWMGDQPPQATECAP